MPTSGKTGQTGNAGRPAKKKKEDVPVTNEEKEKVTMAQSSEVQDRIYLQQVREKWESVFAKYAPTHSSSELLATWNKASVLNNPFLQNERLKQISAKPTKLDKNSMTEALKAPESNEVTLCQASMQMYYNNYVYNILNKLNRDTPKYNYYYVPQYIETGADKKALKKEGQKVDKILKAFEPKLTLKTIATQVSLEGKCSYLTRISYDKNDVDFFLLQKLNTNMIKLTGFGSKQRFCVSFNMAIFLQPAYSVEQYPEFIKRVWEEMGLAGIITTDKNGRKIINPAAKIPDKHIIEVVEGSWAYWVELPQELAWTFYSDGAHPCMIPDFIGLFNDLNDLDDYRWLQASMLSKGVASVLTAEVPLIKDPKAGQDSTAISPDTILGYQDLFAQSVSANILPFFAPFDDFKLHTLESQPEALDIIYDRTRDLIATSGNSALMAITDKPSIASVKAAELIQASRCDYLTRQFEEYLNYAINNFFDLKYKWKIILWGDIFNWREDAKNVKEIIMTAGGTGLIPMLLSAYDMTPEDYLESEKYMDIIGLKFVPPATAAKEEENSSNGTTTGRKAIEEDEIENENTAASRDAGTNVSEIKQYAASLGLNEDEYAELLLQEIGIDNAKSGKPLRIEKNKVQST